MKSSKKENKISIMMGLIKLIMYIYDFVTLPIYFIIQKPWEKMGKSNRIYSEQLPNNPYSPWKSHKNLEPHLTRQINHVTKCTTVSALFVKAAEVHGDRYCFGQRLVLSEDEEMQSDGKVLKKLILGDYHWYSYRQINARVDCISRGLLINGVRPLDIVMIYADTRLEWMMSAQAIFRIGATVATLYTTLGDDAIVHGINETEVTHVITNFELLPKLQRLMSKIPHVRCIIYIEGHKTPQLKGFDEKLQIFPLSYIEKCGNETTDIHGDAPRPETNAFLMYTSGSTGIPKAILMTHKNLMSVIYSCRYSFGEVKPNDVYIAYLPLAHVLELIVELAVYSFGIPLGYSTPLTLTDNSTGIKKGCSGDASLLKPTLMASVPLILNRIHKGITETIERKGMFTKQLFYSLINYKLFWTRMGFNTPLLDFIIFRKIKAMLGGRVRYLLCGGAPLSSDTQEFISMCLSTRIIQGYGLTETTAGATLTDINDMSIGRVGSPLMNVNIKLVDWDEGGYRVTDKPNPRGEIVIGGDCVTAGYFKNDQLTRECFKEEDGIRYFYSGDIGEAFPDGTFKIIDRKKDLIKLQFGEYISLGKIEAELKNCSFIDNICVYGDSLRTYLIAFVVPNARALETLAEELGNGKIIENDLYRNKKIVSAVTKAINEYGLNAKLHKTEIPNKIKLCSEEWTPESGLVTAALKLRRNNIKKYYQKDINQMYNTNNNFDINRKD